MITLAVSAQAQTTVTWTGATSSAWNTGTNWSGGVPPNQAVNNTHALINTSTGNIATISTLIEPPVDIFVGLGAGNTGRLDHTGGTAATGSGNWMFVGRNGGTGTYNLANTAATGGAFTGFGQGFGNMNVGGRLYIGGFEGSGSTGTANVNTTGTLSVPSEFHVGTNTSTGTVNIDSGTISAGERVRIGNGVGSTGHLNMSGGTFNKTGGENFAIGDAGATGTATVTGGTINVNNEFWVGNGGGNGTLNLSNGTVTNNSWLAIARAGAASRGTINMTGGAINKTGGGHFIVGDTGTGVLNQSAGAITIAGECWVGQGGTGVGTYNLSGGTVTNNSWVAIGRQGGNGTVNMTGGTWTKDGAGNFIIGASGPATMTQSAGLVDVQTGITWVAEANNSIATYTLSGSGEFRTAQMVVGRDAGTNATVNLNGGILRAGRLNGQGGTSNVSFNGSQIIATANQPEFINALTTATVNEGGLLIDSQGFNLASSQNFAAGTGSGGLVKTGPGSLTLTGVNAYTGTRMVNAGTLGINSVSDGGNFIVADGAGLTANATEMGDQVQIGNLTLGTSQLTINLGANGAPSVAPLQVNNLQLNGTTALQVNATASAVGQYLLIDAASRTGGGSFTLGSLPRGVQGNISPAGADVNLNITRTADLAWDGSEAQPVWNTTTANWFNLLTFDPDQVYLNGDPVTFDDAVVSGWTDVVLNTAVQPSAVDFNHSFLNYTLTGTGSIAGATGLTKSGAGTATIGTVNTYTGPTRLVGGTLNVGLLANGGSPSAIGASSAAPSNLVFAGGTLNYTGPAVSINRGYSVAAAETGVTSTLATASNLTLSGQVTATAGRFTKLGAGTLTLTHPGENVLAVGTNAAPGSFNIDGGTVVLSGSGTQTNSVTGEVWVGSTPAGPGHLMLDGASLTTSSWLAIGRGNGTEGHLSTVTLNNSTLNTVNFSTGFRAAIPIEEHDSATEITLNNSVWVNNGLNNLAESTGSSGTMTLNGTSSFTSNNRFLMGMGAVSDGHLVLNDTSSMELTAGALSIGFNDTGTFTVRNSASFTNVGDLNVSDVANSTGTLTLQDSGSITTNATFVGKAANTTGAVVMSGGTFTSVGIETFHIGSTGTGTWQQSAGSAGSAAWFVLGRFAGSNGTLEMSGGTMTQSNPERALIIGEAGTAVATLSGTAELVSLATTNIGTAVGWAGGSGVLNLNGGSLTTNRLRGGTGTGVVNFNGGLLRAGGNSNPEFLHGLTTANVRTGGINVDSNGRNIAFTQSLLADPVEGGGGLVKSGTGKLALNGANTYTGTTSVTAGSLGGTGSITGPLAVAAGAVLSPGPLVGTGTFTANGGATLAAGSTLAVRIDESQVAANDALAVGGVLNISGASLQVNLTGQATQLPFTIATFGSLVGTFASVPAGTTVSYGAKSITLTAVAPADTPFEDWIAAFFPGVTDPNIIGPEADPDRDGAPNFLEFALGGNPNDPASSGTTAVFTTDDQLVLTAAVRRDAPAFAGLPTPTSSVDGITYAIEGSLNLGLDGFNSPVTPIAPVTAGLPVLPAQSDYEYRSFRLDASDGLPNRGFLRARVTLDN